MNLSKLLALVLLFAFVSCSTAQKTQKLQQAKKLTQAEYDALKPEDSESYAYMPKMVTPGYLCSAPSDAVVLFDGTDLSQWHHPKHGYGGRMDQVEATMKLRASEQSYTDASWQIKGNSMVVLPRSGAIETKQSFGSMQLHIEWLAPERENKEGQMYSNSGVIIMGLYEVQVLNSYENETYPNGQAGSIYKQHIPLVNASKPPGEWQAYDIIFNAPEFDASGELAKPAYITVMHNGVLIQNHAEIKGPAIYIGQPYYVAHPEKLPLILQDHGDKVRFRNIWAREL